MSVILLLGVDRSLGPRISRLPIRLLTLALCLDLCARVAHCCCTNTGKGECNLRRAVLRESLLAPLTMSTNPAYGRYYYRGAVLTRMLVALSQSGQTDSRSRCAS